MLKDESGKPLAVSDRLKMRFPYEGVCSGVVEQIVPDAKGGKKKGGTVIVQARFAVPYDDADSILHGIIKMPGFDVLDYGVHHRAGKQIPKGVAKVSKAAAPAAPAVPVKEKRRA